MSAPSLETLEALRRRVRRARTLAYALWIAAVVGLIAMLLAGEYEAFRFIE